MNDGQDGIPHAEVYVSTIDASLIKVRCFCRIGSDHDLTAWHRAHAIVEAGLACDVVHGPPIRRPERKIIRP